jgi:hypothetical protein
MRFIPNKNSTLKVERLKVSCKSGKLGTNKSTSAPHKTSIIKIVINKFIKKYILLANE